MTPDTGPVTPRSLARFEDDSTDDIPPLPRPHPARPAATPDKDAGEKVAEIRPTTEANTAPVAGPAEDVPTPPDSSAAARKPRTAQASPDRTRASNVHVPSTLVDLLEAKCRETNLTRGELIVKAIESTADRLPELIHPEEVTVGGRFFDARPSNRAISSEGGRRSPVNYQLREKDFAVLDSLVKQFKARSRGHLIVAALRGYLTE